MKTFKITNELIECVVNPSELVLSELKRLKFDFARPLVSYVDGFNGWLVYEQDT